MAPVVKDAGAAVVVAPVIIDAGAPVVVAPVVKDAGAGCGRRGGGEARCGSAPVAVAVAGDLEALLSDAKLAVSEGRWRPRWTSIARR